MKQTTCVGILLTSLGAVMVGFSASSADVATPAKKPNVRELMQKAHKGDDSPLMNVERGLKVDQPNWVEVRKNAESLIALKKVLAELESVGYRSTKEYVAGMFAFEQAVDKQDRSAAQQALQTVKGTCMTCHRNGTP